MQMGAVVQRLCMRRPCVVVMPNAVEGSSGSGGVSASEVFRHWRDVDSLAKGTFCLAFPLHRGCTYGTAANLTISSCFDEGKLHLVGPTLNARHIFILMHSRLQSER